MEEGHGSNQEPENKQYFRPGEVVSPRSEQTSQDEHSYAPPADTDQAWQADQLAEPMTLVNKDGSVTWTASEFVAHHKTAGWYLVLSVVAGILAVLIWVVTKDVVSVGVVATGAVMLGVYGARQPRQLTYTVDRHGLKIGPKRYHYTEFRSFSIVPEGAFSSIVFMPLKRFAPMITVYYDPDDEGRILDLLAASLPMEERRQDAIDRFLWRIRY